MMHTNLFAQQRLTDLGNKLMGGIVRELGMDVDALLYSTRRTSKDLLSSTRKSAQYSVISVWFPGGRIGEGIVRESGMDMDTLLYFRWRTSKDLLDSTGNSAQRHVAAWLGGEFGGEWIHVSSSMMSFSSQSFYYSLSPLCCFPPGLAPGLAGPSSPFSAYENLLKQQSC